MCIYIRANKDNQHVCTSYDYLQNTSLKLLNRKVSNYELMLTKKSSLFFENELATCALQTKYEQFQCENKDIISLYYPIVLKMIIQLILVITNSTWELQ